MVRPATGTGEIEPPAAEPAAGPQPPRHTRTKAYHWLATTAGLAAVVGVAFAVAPAGASVPVADGPHVVPAADAPDPAGVALPLDCAGQPTVISQRFSADTTGNGDIVTVVAAHCDAGNGTPPDGLFVLRPGTGGKARISAVLIGSAQGENVRRVTVRSDGTIQADVDGYSSDTVPRCCADLHQVETWTPKAPGSDGYTLTATVPLSQV